MIIVHLSEARILFQGQQLTAFLGSTPAVTQCLGTGKGGDLTRAWPIDDQSATYVAAVLSGSAKEVIGVEQI